MSAGETSCTIASSKQASKQPNIASLLLLSSEVVSVAC